MFYEINDTRYNFGYQMGQIYATRVKDTIEADKKDVVRLGMSWEKLQNDIKEYIKISKQFLPEVFQEVLGFSEGAKVKLEDVFIDLTEELFDTPSATKCSEIVVGTENIYIGHNNDVSPEMKADLTFVRYTNEKRQSVYIAGFWGIFPGVGFNTNFYLGGNQLLQNDVKPGIPRGLIARGILDCENIDNAKIMSLESQRASSYNNVIVSKHQVVLIEASATKSEFIEYTGRYAHTNHYLCPLLKQFEASKEVVLSEARLKRIQHLLTESPTVDMNRVKTILADHNSNQAVCRHEADTQTVFSLVGDIENWKFEVCIGNPCSNKFISWK